jgi:hypothetical protein
MFDGALQTLNKIHCYQLQVLLLHVSYCSCCTPGLDVLLFLQTSSLPQQQYARHPSSSAYQANDIQSHPECGLVHINGG